VQAIRARVRAPGVTLILAQRILVRTDVLAPGDDGGKFSESEENPHGVRLHHVTNGMAANLAASAIACDSASNASGILRWLARSLPRTRKLRPFVVLASCPYGASSTRALTQEKVSLRQAVPFVQYVRLTDECINARRNRHPASAHCGKPISRASLELGPPANRRTSR
jgi:hypothetical protein